MAIGNSIEDLDVLEGNPVIMLKVLHPLIQGLKRKSEILDVYFAFPSVQPSAPGY